MKRLEKYIIHNLSVLFLSIFIPLFTIASVVFLIKLATYTAVIELSIWEMTKLYFFVLPELLFYTLPITFFISATLSLFKLSNDNEIIVLFSLGIKPFFLLKTLLKPAIFLTIILLLDFLVLFPHSKILSSNFISYKKSEANFNLSASEFGNSFGNWLLYLGEENEDGSFGKVFLFNKNNKEEILIAAHRAKLINDSGILRLKLSDGEGYSYSKDKFTQINFKTMYINDTLETELYEYKATFKYWFSNERVDAKKKMFIMDTLFSFLPMICLFLALSIGIVHARHAKSQVYLFLFLGVIIFYGATIGLQSIFSFYTIPVVGFTWLIGTYFIYRKTIVKRF
jgi:lipopolysaccharide export system permease protein